MTSVSVLLDLGGGIGLLLWATHMVKTGVLRAFGGRVRAALAGATSGPIKACLTGTIVTGVVQSSSATALLLVTFAERGMVALPAALALMLGADVGSTLVVQALSFDTRALLPVLSIAGVGLFMAASSEVARQCGRALIGLALLLLALGMIVAAGDGLRHSETLAFLLQRLADDPVLAVITGAALAWLMHSSVAMVLLAIALANAGVIATAGAAMLVLGANIGSACIPLALTWGAPISARRALWGNLAFRALGVMLCVAACDLWLTALPQMGASPARQLANLHTLLNVAVLMVCLPLVVPSAKLLTRLIADDQGGRPSQTPLLDEMLLDRPQVALGNATREIVRLGGMVETMLQSTLDALKGEGAEPRDAIRQLETPVDRTHAAIKLYLTKLTRRSLSPDESRRAFDLIVFTTNLEQIGDIIHQSLLRLATKRQKQGLAFSPEGWTDIATLHARVAAQMQLALSLLVNPDLASARELVAEKDRIRVLERTATAAHLRRLRDGMPASLETSALHLDILRDLKRINAHIVSAAYPILEAAGELRDSRLKAAATSDAVGSGKFGGISPLPAR